MKSLLVVAPEPSAQRMAALVADAMRDRVEAYRVAGEVGALAGIAPVGTARGLDVMGLTDALGAGARAIASLAAVTRAVARRPPAAALLVSSTALNARLGSWLRGRGVPVLWCVAPQVWAWGGWRTPRLARSMDRLAAILPFEVEAWRAANVDAHYVGHPSFEAAVASARRDPGENAPRLALLPGSRHHEVRRLASPMAMAASQLRASGRTGPATFLLSSALAASTRDHAEDVARRHDLAITQVDAAVGAGPLLGRFDLTIAASGTACLEAALAGAPPVIAYRTDAVTHWAARRLVTAPHVGLPNLVLGREAYPERIQADANAPSLARAAEALLLRRDELARSALELRRRLAPPHPELGFGARVARLFDDWLA